MANHRKEEPKEQVKEEPEYKFEASNVPKIADGKTVPGYMSHVYQPDQNKSDVYNLRAGIYHRQNELMDFITNIKGADPKVSSIKDQVSKQFDQIHDILLKQLEHNQGEKPSKAPEQTNQTAEFNNQPYNQLNNQYNPYAQSNNQYNQSTYQPYSQPNNQPYPNNPYPNQAYTPQGYPNTRVYTQGNNRQPSARSGHGNSFIGESHFIPVDDESQYGDNNLGGTRQNIGEYNDSNYNTQYNQYGTNYEGMFDQNNLNYNQPELKKKSHFVPHDINTMELDQKIDQLRRMEANREENAIPLDRVEEEPGRLYEETRDNIDQNSTELLARKSEELERNPTFENKQPSRTDLEEPGQTFGDKINSDKESLQERNIEENDQEREEQPKEKDLSEEEPKKKEISEISDKEKKMKEIDLEEDELQLAELEAEMEAEVD